MEVDDSRTGPELAELSGRHRISGTGTKLMRSNYSKNTTSYSVRGGGTLRQFLVGTGLLMLLSAETLDSQTSRAQELLENALSLANLYNWADAAADFGQAERIFTQAGDRRNALYAHLGLLRATIEQKQNALPAESAQLALDLASNPLLQSDKELRMFALIVKGDIDTETNTGAMRHDWEAVEQLAGETGDKKWQYRALAQLGIASFYNGDLEAARKQVGTALQRATDLGDNAAQVRFLTILANGLVQTK